MLVETRGARHQEPRRSRSNTQTSKSCAARKAVPEASAIRGVANHTDSTTASAKPAKTTRRAAAGPISRLARSVTRNANG